MAEAKKYILIDPSNIKQLSQLLNQENERSVHTAELSPNSRLQPLKQRQTYQIDKKMLDIVNNDKLTSEEKVTAYNQALIEFQSLISSKTPTAPPITPSRVENETEEPIILPSGSQEIHTIGIASKYQKKGSALLKYLLDSNKLKILSSGHVVINNQKLSDANITDLVNRAINPVLPKYDSPGWDSFESLLRDANVPRLLVSSNVNLTKTPSPRKSYHSSSASSAETLSPQSKKPVTDWLEHDSPQTSKRKKKAKK